jgi:hypothetical protein
VKKPLRILSLGAGVQSSTLALMATHGDIEPVHAYICKVIAGCVAAIAFLGWLIWKAGKDCK